MGASTRAFGLALLLFLAGSPLAGQMGAALRPASWSDPASGRTLLTATPSPGTAWGDRVGAVDHGRQHPASQAAGKNRRKGALWGAGVGLVAGGILGGLSVSSDEDDGFAESIVESAATGPAVLLGAVVGAGVGALLGATVFAPARSVGTAGAPGMAIELAPARHGPVTGVGIGLRWAR